MKMYVEVSRVMSCWYRTAFLLVIIGLLLSHRALAIDAQQVNAAQPSATSNLGSEKLDPLVIKIEILLDRAHFSPGEIDGKRGENVTKALTAFAAAHGTNWSEQWTPELWQAVTNGAADNLFTHYTITEDDVRGPFLRKLPRKMEAMKDLPGLYYSRPREELAERFHVSEDLLAALNPHAKFQTAGESLVVPAVTDDPLKGQVAQIMVDKSAQTVKAFDAQDQLLAFYPATVGSEEKPAPSGRLKVTIIKKNPAYHYNPKYHFKGVKTRKPFTIKPGPNNPVGVVWIGLSGEGYGIHGTPDPDKVSKTESHGCVRLTNWDALQLAAAVRQGIPVDFVGED
jgi:lipoprotein-anchoring transpeptidase ErfK/SrfK